MSQSLKQVDRPVSNIRELTKHRGLKSEISQIQEVIERLWELPELDELNIALDVFLIKERVTHIAQILDTSQTQLTGKVRGV